MLVNLTDVFSSEGKVVNKEYLIGENEKAKKALTTRNCREECNNCGAACYKGGVCIEKR